ncbi:hypothetical protein MRX96_022652 [Rhipicephalus microplus]
MRSTVLWLRQKWKCWDVTALSLRRTYIFMLSLSGQNGRHCEMRSFRPKANTSKGRAAHLVGTNVKPEVSRLILLHELEMVLPKK